jgi:WhiB family redox-sensing transcriptional regulator
VTYDRLPRLVEGPIHQEWVERAACAGAGPDMFFQLKGGSNLPAKAVCATCPVRQECLDYAVGQPEQWGVWGGMDRNERRAYARTRRAAS